MNHLIAENRLILNLLQMRLRHVHLAEEEHDRGLGLDDSAFEVSFDAAQEGGEVFVHHEHVTEIKIIYLPTYLNKPILPNVKEGTNFCLKFV